jgi:hypothetical protein
VIFEKRQKALDISEKISKIGTETEISGLWRNDFKTSPENRGELKDETRNVNRCNQMYWVRGVCTRLQGGQ